MYQQLRRPLLFLFMLIFLATSMPPVAQAQTYAFEVYNEPNYAGGWCYSNTPITANIAPSCNDLISSALLSPGWSARVYRDQNESGPSICLNHSDADFSDNTFEDGSPLDNAISSFVLYSQSYCAGAPVPAYPLEVYSDPGYGGGWCYSWRSEAANIFGSCNDLVSSVLLRSGWSMRVYRDQNQAGSHGCLTGSDNNLADNTFFDGSPMNDAISSFILYSQGNCANAAPNIPTPSGPANGSSLNNGTVTLAWTDPGDPDNWPRTYRDYNAEIRKSDNSWNAILPWQTATSWTLTVPGEGTYIWHVQSGDGMSGSGWSVDRSFSVGTVVQPEPDTALPDGQIITPAEGARIGPSSVNFSATAWDNAGGSGVNRVEFYVSYNGGWHLVGNDTSAPYGISWVTPGDLRSQQLRFTIHVVDNSGNSRVDPGGYRFINFIESSNSGSQIVEKWVPLTQRAYLNQLSLGTDGWRKCSAASMAMVLAMNGIIGKDYTTMAARANSMFTKVQPDMAIWRVTNELRNQGATSTYYYYGSPDKAWPIIKQEIDAERPIILGTGPKELTQDGHYIVAVGYREERGVRSLIIYDPYGKWLQTSWTGNNYDRNSTEPASYKGQWVYYDYGKVIVGDGWLITARAKTVAVLSSAIESPPDPISDEPAAIVRYDGVPIQLESQLLLPMIIR